MQKSVTLETAFILISYITFVIDLMENERKELFNSHKICAEV